VDLAGAIVDLEAVGNSIRSAVHAAEEMAGEQIERVVVSLSGGFAGSRIVKAEIEQMNTDGKVVANWETFVKDGKSAKTGKAKGDAKATGAASGSSSNDPH